MVVEIRIEYNIVVRLKLGVLVHVGEDERLSDLGLVCNLVLFDIGKVT